MANTTGYTKLRFSKTVIYGYGPFRSFLLFYCAITLFTRVQLILNNAYNGDQHLLRHIYNVVNTAINRDINIG